VTRFSRSAARPADTIESHEFRAACGLFATGVTIITTTMPDGQFYAMTANSFTSVSLQPKLVLACLNNTSRGLAAIVQAGVFAVSVLSDVQAELSRHFADPKRSAGSAAFADFGCSVGAVGCPHFDDSVAAFDCRVHAIYPGGDHAIVVGEVVALAVEPESEPLVFHRGKYRFVEGIAVSRVA